MTATRSDSPDHEAPYLWQSKEALYRIENAQAVRNHGNAKLVYQALTWIASDEQSPVFKAEIAAIARKSSLGYRTVWGVLPELENLALVIIARPKLRGPATFTICTTRKTFGTTRKTFCKRKQSSFADSTKERRIKKNGPLSTADRIGLERRLTILKNRAKELRDDTAEAWQQREHPEKLTELRELQSQIKAHEDQLLSR